MLTVGCLGRQLDILCVFKTSVTIFRWIRCLRCHLLGLYRLLIYHAGFKFLRVEKKKKVIEKGEVFPGGPIKSFAQSTIRDSPGTPERCYKNKFILIVHRTDFNHSKS